MRRTVAVGGLLTTVFTANAPTASGIEAVSVKPYVDLHVDLPYQYNYKNAPFLYGTGQFSAAEAQRGGLAAVVLPLFVPFNVSDHGPRVIDYEQSWQQVKRALDTQKVYAHPGVEPAEGQVRTFYSFEGMGPLGQDLRSLELWVHRGVRLFGLVHNQHNDLAASALDFHGEDFGLTALGQNVVARVYELGGIVDISHASDRTARDVVRIALSLRRPVVATHSNARRLLDHRRNLPDELIDDVAKTGGIIGVNFHSAFLVAGRRATLSDVIRHILYIAGRVGAEHVAIGSDFEGGIRPPRGLETLGQVQHLVPALRAAGLTEDEVQGIMGANALRVLFSRKTGPENKAP
jgi:membrane dipeptidase